MKENQPRFCDNEKLGFSILYFRFGKMRKLTDE